ncbi:hypothetical protein [Mucilaginibacter gynuensis]
MLKNTFIKAAAASILLFGSLSVNAQSKWRIGFGVDPGLATKDPFQYTLGGDIRLQRDFNNRVSGTLTAGFTHFFEKDHFTGFNQYGSPYNVIPVKAGIKYFVANKLYVGGEAGVGFGFEQWGNSFLWSPSVGLTFSNGLDMSVKYEDYTRSSITRTLALCIAYGFSLKKLSVHKKADAPEGWLLGLAVSPGQTTEGSNGFTLGGELSLHHRLTSNLDASLSGGITHYFSTYPNYYVDQSTVAYSFRTDTTTSNVIPLKAGLRLFAGKKFYVGGEAGIGFATKGGSQFVYSPSIGLQFKNGIDAGIKYEAYSGHNIADVLALRLRYLLKL